MAPLGEDLPNRTLTYDPTTQRVFVTRTNSMTTQVELVSAALPETIDPAAPPTLMFTPESTYECERDHGTFTMTRLAAG